MTKQQKSDKYFRWFLIFAFLYFLGHFISGLAHAQSAPPVIQCWTNNFGVVQCIQL